MGGWRAHLAAGVEAIIAVAQTAAGHTCYVYVNCSDCSAPALLTATLLLALGVTAEVAATACAAVAASARQPHREGPAPEAGHAWPYHGGVCRREEQASRLDGAEKGTAVLMMPRCMQASPAARFSGSWAVLGGYQTSPGVDEPGEAQPQPRFDGRARPAARMHLLQTP